MPKGYLFKFVPEVSGVYRVNSHSDQEVVGWIFIGSNEEWAEAGGDRTILTHYDVGERYSPDLLIDPDGDGKYERDYTNVSLTAYMEAGKEYYIDIAYYDTYGVGTFSFDVIWEAESFGYFIQASNGPITYIESIDGGMGQLIAAGIKYTFVEEDGVEYAYHVRGYDENGDPILGEKIYADFYQSTTLFPTQSIETLIKANAFNYMITEKDREALILLDEIRLNGKVALIEKWIDEELVADEEAAEALWSSTYNAIVKDLIDDTVDGAYTAEQLAYAQYAISEGKLALLKEWAVEEITSYVWTSNDMDNVIRGKFSEDAGTKAAQEALLREVNIVFENGWAYYQMDDVKVGIYHNTDNRSDKDLTAQRYLEIFNTEGKDALKALWDVDFDSIVPPSDEEVSDISEWRYNYFWAYYQMDDVQNGVFHGVVADFTDEMLAYVEKMENDIANNPERQGCVAVTRELTEILDTLIAREVFEDVKDGWLKFCYYYELLGVEIE